MLLVLVDPGAAQAGGTDSRTAYTRTGPNTGQVSVEEGRGAEATAGVHRTGRDPWAGCDFQSIDDPAVIAGITRTPVEQVLPSPSGWWLVICNGGDGTSVGEAVFIWTRSQGLPPAVRDRLIEAAIDALEVPFLMPRSSPAGTLDHPLLTGLETWLWVDAESWRPVHARAAIPVATVTAQAEPDTITWDAGDGTAPTSCTGPGTPWTTGAPGPAPCGHTFRHTNHGTTTPLSITVTWHVTWTCEPACGTGTAAPFVLTTNRPVTIHQVQTRLNR